MATKQYYFTGTCKWAKFKTPDDKYNKYTVDLYLDHDSWETYDESGLTLKIRENEDGRFVKFSREHDKSMRGKVVTFGPPVVKNENLEDWDMDVAIGNGSTLTVRVSVYDSKNGKGHRLEAVRVDELIEFNPEGVPEVQVGTEELPF